MSPRRRSRTAKLPNGIKPDALPPYVYWDASGKGRWILHTYDSERRKTKARRLCGPECTLREIWDAYEAATRPVPIDTLGALMDLFERSPAWEDLKPTTQRDYRLCMTRLKAAKTRAGVALPDTRLADWTPGTVRAYVDKRAEESRSRANHELRYLRRVFAWGYERDFIASNPGRGVKTLKEAPRQRYVTDNEYAAFLEHAGQRYPYLVPVAELAYLCRLRLSEVCDLRREDAREEGLFAARRKGSKDALTGWTPRLRAAVDAALALHGDVLGLYLIPSPSHGRMLETTVQTAWQRSMRSWADLGRERFSIHDCKRKGVSDAEGDKLAASGHRSAAMLRVYDVLPAKAPATR
ncbi:site-specific integrase [Thiorhodococcus fuscus]|uniref:Tyrosine recombinase XerC n=1 Tax=Thiorhodococcus fuscus TaxID=527200 RepID=A0ABW4Y7R5_9GAMM